MIIIVIVAKLAAEFKPNLFNVTDVPVKSISQAFIPQANHKVHNPCSTKVTGMSTKILL
jgi:hypothetical protein